MSNKEIWNLICETPPKHTKPVTQGSHHYTSIQTQYRLERMTDLFGPCGVGWGFSSECREVRLEDGNVLAVATVVLWYVHKDEHGIPARMEIGPYTSSEQLFLATAKKPIDTDAYKKATTDALGKIMAHMGMCADVYYSMHDDQKYVEERRQEHASVDRGVAAIRAAKTREDLSAVVKKLAVTFNSGRVGDAAMAYLKSVVAEKEESLSVIAEEEVGEGAEGSESGNSFQGVPEGPRDS